MKKIFFIIIAVLAVVFLFCASAFAKTGDVIGSIYSTDILAYINGVPVPSYNIGGKTAVIVEDLADYGVTCHYNDQLRTLVVTLDSVSAPPQTQVSRGKTGKVVGKIYETDIKTYVNGILTPAFSLNGKMAVAIEDLCAAADPATGYSPYGTRFVWNATDRTVSMEYLYDNTSEVYALLASSGKPFSLRIDDDTVTLIPDYLYGGGRSMGIYVSFTPLVSYPLSCNERQVGTVFRRYDIYFFCHDDGSYTLDPANSATNLYCFDLTALKSIIDDTVVPLPTYDDLMTAFLNNHPGGMFVVLQADTPECTFFYTRVSMTVTSDSLIRIGKDGTYHDYAADFAPTGYGGALTFSHVEADGDQVTFQYDGTDEYYSIDLKTGVMTKISE